jgi:hypothetical protein
LALLPPRHLNVSTVYAAAVTGGDSTRPIAGPFFLAMVDEDETTFGPEHHRMDEYVFDIKFILAEGDKPKLELEIENPRVGLLSALRKQWCWLSWYDGATVVPMFFGRIVGIPSDLQAETIHVTFIAWPSNFDKQLQKVAAALKIAPFYDAVFTDVARRDDPMAIFESHSKMICVDPVTNVVSASDILDAEDGNEDFTEDDHFYDSLSISPGAVPKTVVHIDASVSWTQTARGYLDMGQTQVTTYSGDGMMSEWPKPLQSIAPGLTVFTSNIVDTAGIDNVQTVTLNYQWQSRAKRHEDGDALSVSTSSTFPVFNGDPGPLGTTGYMITYKSQSGVLDPFAVDVDGDPKPTNIPPSLQFTNIYAAPYQIKTSLMLEYQAARPHTERIIFNLFADVQPTALDPLVTEDGEVITISGCDVGVPLIDLLNWTSVSGQFVSVGTLIFPNDPRLPGGQTIQIATIAGTAGEFQPDFSDVPGETTVDGTVTWASLGTSSAPESAPDWTGLTTVPLGAMILPRRPIYTTYAAFVAAGEHKFPPTGTPINEGTVLQNGATFLVCTVGGTIGGPGNDTATMVTLSSIPDGKTYFVATTAGTTGARYVVPNFDTDLHATTTDGTVVWTAVGIGEIPVGGTPGNVTGGTYFGSDRGFNASVPYLLCRARARLRFASRCVSTTFQTSWERGLDLSLRKSVTLHDYRIPGGLMTGKITNVEMIASGGAFFTNVTIMSSVGREQVLSEVPGDPLYVDEGYVGAGYQTYENTVLLLPVVSDVGYSPLVPQPDEDGITFPMSKSMIVVNEGYYGDLDDQVAGILTAFASMRSAADTLTQPTSSVSEMVLHQNQAKLLNSNSVGFQLQQNPRWYQLEMKPLNGRGVFNKVYHLECTTLQLPRMIDMEEEVTT